jgi:T-complex protein 1 subunit delta
MSSKVVSQNSNLLAPLTVNLVLGRLGMDSGSATNVDLQDVRMVEQLGRTVDDTELVHGLVFNKGSTKTAGGAGEDQECQDCADTVSVWC